MSSNEYAILIVRSYISRLGKPEFAWSRHERAQRVYARWAANEILNELKLKKKSPPLGVIENFAERVNQYSCVNKKTSYAFSVAYDTAMDIIDLFVK